MSTTKLDTSGVFQAVKVHAPQTRLSLPANSIRIRKNGIEFRSDHSIPAWTEMTVDLFSPVDGKKIHCTGVVVECHGNRHTGYTVAMVFMNLSRQSQERLAQLAFSARL
ncbi:MAG: PilZ domain-containing protein [Verrucomicrobiota bacterium]|jgi:hypothetical protein